MNGFAKRLKELREKAGLTQGELAEKTGLSRGGLANLEQGLRGPAWETVQRVAAALGVDCTAFQIPPGETTVMEPTSRGRPAKNKAGKKPPSKKK